MFNYLYVICKIVLIILLIAFFVVEYRANKKGEMSCKIGIVLMVSLFSTPAPMLSFFISLAFSIIWLCFIYIDRLSKLKFVNTFFFFYILPMIMYLASYSIGLLILYGVVSFLVLFQIYEVFLVFMMIAALLYLFSFIKFVILKFKYKITLKESLNRFNKISFLPFLFLPYLSLLIL